MAKTYIKETIKGYEFCLSFQKQIYRLFKQYNFDNDGYFGIQDIHSKYYRLMVKEPEKHTKGYFNLLYTIHRKFVSKSEKMGILNERLENELNTLYHGIKKMRNEHIKSEFIIQEGKESNKNEQMKKE